MLIESKRNNLFKLEISPAPNVNCLMFGVCLKSFLVLTYFYEIPKSKKNNLVTENIVP